MSRKVSGCCTAGQQQVILPAVKAYDRRVVQNLKPGGEIGKGEFGSHKRIPRHSFTSSR